MRIISGLYSFLSMIKYLHIQYIFAVGFSKACHIESELLVELLVAIRTVKLYENAHFGHRSQWSSPSGVSFYFSDWSGWFFRLRLGFDLNEIMMQEYSNHRKRL